MKDNLWKQVINVFIHCQPFQVMLSVCRRHQIESVIRWCILSTAGKFKKSTKSSCFPAISPVMCQLSPTYNTLTVLITTKNKSEALPPWTEPQVSLLVGCGAAMVSQCQKLALFFVIYDCKRRVRDWSWLGASGLKEVNSGRHFDENWWLFSGSHSLLHTVLQLCTASVLRLKSTNGLLSRWFLGMDRFSRCGMYVDWEQTDRL